MKHLLLITNDFPYGESERSFLLTEFREMRKYFAITILALCPPQSVKYSAPTDTVCKRYVWKKNRCKCVFQLGKKEVQKELSSMLKNNKGKNKFYGIAAILWYGEASRQVLKKIEEIHKEKPIDIIYTYWCTSATLASVQMKKRNPSIKVLTRFHGCDLFLERTRANWQPFRAVISQNCDALIFASCAGKQYFVEHWGGANKSRTAYLGCPKFPYVKQNESEKFIVLSCSNLIPIKRVDVIFQAVKILANHQKTEWHHFGDGIVREGLEKAARQAEQEMPNLQCVFHGHIENEHIAEEYRKICPDVFVTTSSTEGGCPVSIAEALSMGIPIIATNLDCMQELVRDNVNGFLVSEAADPREVADAIKRFKNIDASQQKEMKMAAKHQWEEYFNAQKNAKLFCEFLVKM